MSVEFTREELSGIVQSLEAVLRIIGYAQGREESYAARRAEFQILNFPQTKKSPSGKEAEEKKQKNVILAFLRKNKKEISNMSKSKQEKIKKIIERPPRYHKGTYEKRALIDGIELYACGGSSEDCERKFLTEITKKILSEETQEKSRVKTSTVFSEWAELWFDQVFKPNVTPTTFENEYYRYKKYLRPAFGKMKLREIKPMDCVKFFNGLLERDLGRTAESCYGDLNRIFKFALESNLIDKNPMSALKPIKSERKNGVPLSKEEEKLLLEEIRGQKHEAVLILALYTGLRPCEHSSARIEGDFIVAQNRKQKNVKKIVFKKIPITPMLRPYLPIIQACMEKDWASYTVEAHKTIRKILPNHRLYDLRTTFATRCQECGVPDTVVQVWLGHKAKTLLGQVYTKFSDDFLLKEGKKVRY